MTDAAFALRPDKNDAVVYEQVVRRNEYRLPDQLAPDSVVVDIGVHIGAFSYLALSRGAGTLHGFEPVPENLACARRNLAPFGARVHLDGRAVWRSDVPASSLHFWPSSDAANAGGGTLIWDTNGPMVNVVPFDAVIDAVSEHGRRRIDWLKIDCEGAEFPILLTSQRLGSIDRIVGEYHELRETLPAHVRVPGCDQFALEVLVAHLNRAGFDVAHERQAKGVYGDLGLFFATRR